MAGGGGVGGWPASGVVAKGSRCLDELSPNRSYIDPILGYLGGLVKP